MGVKGGNNSGEVLTHGISALDVCVVVQPPVWLTNAPRWMEQPSPDVVQQDPWTDSIPYGFHGFRDAVNDMGRGLEQIGHCNFSFSDFLFKMGTDEEVKG